MVSQLSKFMIIAPELWLLGMTCLILMVGAFARKTQHVVFSFTAVALFGALLMVILNWHAPTEVLFNNAFIFDPLAKLLKMGLYGLALFVLGYSNRYMRNRQMPELEYQVLALLSIIGMSVLISAAHFITVFLGLELLSLPLYAMVALRRDHGLCTEAAMKLFVISALATAFLLYGMSLIYGATGTLVIQDIASQLPQAMTQHGMAVLFGLVFMLVAIAVELGLVPFHMWLPDVYEGAPSCVTLFIGSLPKLAGFAMLARLLVGALPGIAVHWQPILMVMALLSMGLGNLAAIWQTNIKRMLAYSAIAQMGMFLLGFVTATPEGYSASLFYVLTYALTTTAAFGLIVLMSHGQEEVALIDDFRGLNQRNPWLAFLWLMILFSLTGIPPFVGFFAKWYVLAALVHQQMYALSAIMMLFSVVGAYYYLRVIKVIYFDEPLVNLSQPITPTYKRCQLSIIINTSLLLVLGIFPGWLYQFCVLT